MTLVSRETESLLKAYVDLLLKWNTKINLVSQNTVSDIWTRHIEDSLQVYGLAGSLRGNWVDLGSGGGLPGIVVATALRNEDVNITLIESDARKCAFLRTAARTLGLTKVAVINDRIEEIHPLNAAIVSARALAHLGDLLAFAHWHLAPNGVAYFMKGRNWLSECRVAQKKWSFDYIAHPSKTDPEAAIIQISGVTHV